MADTVSPLISVPQLLAFGSDIEQFQNQNIWTAPQLESLVLTATSAIESRCDRRLAPFTGLTESDRASGVDIEGIGLDDLPLDLMSALGRSQSMSYGAVTLVRDYWLREYAPVRQDLWSYSIQNIELLRVYGGAETVPVGTLEGPEADTGHIRFQLGTFIPQGTTIRITYGGGYTQIPYDLQMATVFQAIKLVLIGAEPEERSGMSQGELDTEIMTLIAPYVRY